MVKESGAFWTCMFVGSAVKYKWKWFFLYILLNYPTMYLIIFTLYFISEAYFF